jgi:hypothetical protein
MSAFTTYKTPVNSLQPPPIPARRLFQISDWWGTSGNQTGGQPQTPASNASAGVDPNTSATGDPRVNSEVSLPNLSNQVINYNAVYGGTTLNYIIDLTASLTPYLDTTNPPNALYVSSTLGGANDNTGDFNVKNPNPPPPNLDVIPDQRDHPAFRTEMMQRMMSLTTVRTHQYAVWITVGFFEVLQTGDAQLFNYANAVRFAGGTDRACDVMGLELGIIEGKNVRYRGFFLVDRTQATGFNPAAPGDFRSCVVYRQTIE